MEFIAGITAAGSFLRDFVEAVAEPCFARIPAAALLVWNAANLAGFTTVSHFSLDSAAGSAATAQYLDIKDVLFFYRFWYERVHEWDT